MKKNFIQRTITALVFVMLIIASVFINQYVFGIVFLIITSISLAEFYLLTEKGGFKPQKKFGIFIGAVVFIVSFLFTKKIIDEIYFYVFIPLIIVLVITELYRKKDHHFRCIAFTFYGIIYISIPFSMLNYISANPFTNNDFSPVLIFSFFALIWINDTGAYITGTLIGKHKLFERISPQKTWEGTIGGAVFTHIAAFIMSLIYSRLSLFAWLGFALIVSVFGTYGDLAESMLKRRAGVKDSGHILPGHGGLLDRFDGMFFTAPMIFLYLNFLDKYIY